MPIAPYTLDGGDTDVSGAYIHSWCDVPDGFDESRTLILDPSVFVSDTGRRRVEPEEAASKTRNKRRLVDSTDSCQTTKRSKLSPLNADKNDDTGDDTLIQPDEVINDKTTQFISLTFAAPGRQSKVSKAVKKFESCISLAPPRPRVEAPKEYHGTPA